MAESSVSPIVLQNGEGESLWAFGSLITIKASADTTAGGVSVIEHLSPGGSGSPLHVHRNEDEWFYVIDGELTFWVGGGVISAAAGAFVYGPRNVPHTYLVASPMARFLVVAEPGGFDKFVRELSQPALTPTAPPPASEPPDIDKIVATAARYGIEILGPPGIPAAA